jgi:TonB family protein
MPGKNWILQYCMHDTPAASPVLQSNSLELRLDSGIVPPSAVEQFDFHRPPGAQSDASRKGTIILQGVIREDGSVGELKVLQGLSEAVDQAALAAFSRWKFRPAQRSNKPIAVEILVGIPVILPTT